MRVGECVSMNAKLKAEIFKRGYWWILVHFIVRQNMNYVAMSSFVVKKKKKKILVLEPWSFFPCTYHSDLLGLYLPNIQVLFWGATLGSDQHPPPLHWDPMLSEVPDYPAPDPGYPHPLPRDVTTSPCCCGDQPRGASRVRQSFIAKTPEKPYADLVLSLHIQILDPYFSQTE